MELDRQGIERRDFPISRRGYDPAAVDGHLRALAADVEDLRRHLDEQQGSPASLGSAAASQVRGILEAAESTAADIERQATDDAARMRAEASADARQTREEAVGRAQAHVAAVAQAAASLLARVESMDGEVATLVQSLQAGAGRLAGDLASMQTEMGALYDAAAGRGLGPATDAVAVPVSAAAPPPVAESSAPASPPPAVVPGHPPTVSPTPATAPPASPEPVVAAPSPAIAAVASATKALNGDGGSAPVEDAAPPGRVASAGQSPPAAQPTRTAANGPAQSGSGNGGGDLDGARLVALNMALNGESREQTDRYLQENFALADRARLLDEVYAAIEI